MIEETITRINEYLKEELWMDFALFETESRDVVLSGRIDDSNDEKIRIIFKQPFMTSCTYYITYEGGGNFIEIITGEDAYRTNVQYGVSLYSFV